MSQLSPRLQIKVQQKQTLTPGLVQMVTVLQLNKLELREMIANEISENPLLEEVSAGEELTPGEIQATLEVERDPHPADESIVFAAEEIAASDAVEAPIERTEAGMDGAAEVIAAEPVKEPEAADPFNEIDFGTFFDDYLDPGFRSPASEQVDKPSFETFLSAPVTLADYLQQQLSLVVLADAVREAADSIIGNLDENGYVTLSAEEIAASGEHALDAVNEALTVVQSLDPAGVGARDLQQCLLLQLASRNAQGSVAWQIVSDHLRLLEVHRKQELAKALGRPMEHIEIAIDVIQHLDPRPGLRYASPATRHVEPDVYIFKEGDEYFIQLNDEDLPQLRLNMDYRHMLRRDGEPDKEVRDYVKDRYASALQLIKNIEQRKQTILKVCQAIIGRQTEFLERGIDSLRPMMIKEVAEEIGVHPSTVSRAVANKYAHTPQGVFELRYFFSEAVQGPSGAATPLLILKRKVKKMIEDEDTKHPLTDEQITARLRDEGVQVTRRTVAKYREDMKIPSTHHRRVRD
ncbi:MAG: RNA polymerase factor sigma-54 [Bryobacteraceae bacterium]|nr:RNA polymerase factor sigma-54 [Bryobacteraceae bacterium]